jgi:hypothetical protein
LPAAAPAWNITPLRGTRKSPLETPESALPAGFLEED